MTVSRHNAIIGEAIDLRATFRTADGVVFDPYELRQVEIIDSDGDVVETIGAASITRVEAGVYKVTAAALASAGTYNDRWYVRPFQGADETSKTFRVEVTVWDAEVDLPVSVQHLKDVYLFGIDLTDDAGNPFPDAMFESAIQMAIARIERTLDIDVSPKVWAGATAERHDYFVRDYKQFAAFSLDRRPVIEVTAVKAVYPSSPESEIITFPEEWVTLTIPESGQINIVPHSGSLAHFVIGRGGAYLPLIYSGGADCYPDLFRVEYKSGFEHGSMPADVKHLISLHAAIQIFNVAGDLIIGAGIANISLGVDGLHKTIGTTSSATNAGYGARIVEYNKEIKEYEKALRRYYHGAEMVVA